MTEDPRERRLAARRAVLRNALRHGPALEIAWAASRARVLGIGLDPDEARAARRSRRGLGRALRAARARHALAARDAVTIASAANAPRRRLGPGVAVAALATGLLVTLALRWPGAEDEGRAAVAEYGATQTTSVAAELRSRGRTALGVVAVPLPEVPVEIPHEPLAVAAPAPAPAAGAPRAGGSGSGSAARAGAGTGPGAGAGTGDRVSSPPAIARVGLRVVDALTGRPLLRACVIARRVADPLTAVIAPPPETALPPASPPTGLERASMREVSELSTLPENVAAKEEFVRRSRVCDGLPPQSDQFGELAVSLASGGAVYDVYVFRPYYEPAHRRFVITSDTELVLRLRPLP